MPKNKKYVLLHYLESKHSLLMKFDQFMSHYKRKNFIEKFRKNCDLETSSRPFCVYKELSTTFIGKWNFWSKLPIQDMYLQNYQNCQNQHTDLLTFLSTKDSLKIKKGLEVVPGLRFLYNFLIKNFLL